jgi:hypothetical protein
MGKTSTGWSERVRQVVDEAYVSPARGNSQIVRIPFGELKAKLVAMGFPSGHANQVVTPLESKRFWGPRGLTMVSVKHQPRTVESVLEFRFAEDSGDTVAKVERMRRGLEAFDRVRGSMKEEIAAFGGTEAFLRWVRSEDEKLP